MKKQRPINTANGISGTITAHYHKECWSNFVPLTKSLIKATAVLICYE